MTCSPRRPNYLWRKLLDAANQLLAVDAGVAGERRVAQEHAQQRDALHPVHEVGARRHLPGDDRRVEREDAELALRICLRARSGMLFQTSAGVVCCACTKIVPPSRRPAERIAAAQGVHVVDDDELDVLKLAVGANWVVGQRQVVGGRQPLLLGAVLRVGLHVQAEQVRRRRSRSSCSS